MSSSPAEVSMCVFFEFVIFLPEIAVMVKHVFFTSFLSACKLPVI